MRMKGNTKVFLSFSPDGKCKTLLSSLGKELMDLLLIVKRFLVTFLHGLPAVQVIDQESTGLETAMSAYL